MIKIDQNRADGSCLTVRKGLDAGDVDIVFSPEDRALMAGLDSRGGMVWSLSSAIAAQLADAITVLRQ